MDQEQYELIRRVASVLGHELRNPLAVINNSAYFVKTKLGAAPDPDPKVEKHLGIIASEIARADSLIADLLAFSRPLEIKPAPASLAAVVDEALKSCSVPDGINVKRLQLKSEVTVNADARILADAMRRIIANAVEAMSGSGTLTINAAVSGGRVSLEFRDTGPGIKPEALSTLFNPFRTTKPRGLGLGLAMAQKIAAAHNGSIAAKNPRGGGASVTLSLPKA